jgi:ubiquinone/menaquinone biosynthesis C-methylase UbiE
MNMENKPGLQYSARDSYQGGSSIQEYERKRFSGLLGRYRYRREQRAVGYLVGLLPDGVTILDCPCGNGRWWPVLLRKARQILAMDISRGMLDQATRHAEELRLPVEVRAGDAENLALADRSVDYVFSHALTKHLPIPIQYRVLAEFARVARRGVICSFGIFTPLSYEIWRRRHLKESYPTFYEELEWMASFAGLKIQTRRSCTTPIGVENTVLFEKSAEAG